MRAEFRVMMSFLLMYDIKKKTQTHNKQTNKQTTTTPTIKKQNQSKCPTSLLPL